MAKNKYELKIASQCNYTYINKCIATDELIKVQHSLVKQICTTNPAKCNCILVHGKTCNTEKCKRRKIWRACEQDCKLGCCNNPWANKSFAAWMGKVEAKNAGEKGNGLFAKERIEAGSYITEFTGEFQPSYHDTPTQNLKTKEYLFEMPYFGQSINASNFGSCARLINHSIVPNCEARFLFYYDYPRVVIVALQDIDLGTELTLRYRWVFNNDNENPKCLCNEKDCSGKIGTVTNSTSTQFPTPVEFEYGTVINMDDLPKKSRHEKPTQIMKTMEDHIFLKNQGVIFSFKSGKNLAVASGEVMQCYRNLNNVFIYLVVRKGRVYYMPRFLVFTDRQKAHRAYKMYTQEDLRQVMDFYSHRGSWLAATKLKLDIPTHYVQKFHLQRSKVIQHKPKYNKRISKAIKKIANTKAKVDLKSKSAKEPQNKPLKASSSPMKTEKRVNFDDPRNTPCIETKPQRSTVRSKKTRKTGLPVEEERNMTLISITSKKNSQMEQDHHATPETQSPFVQEGQVSQDNYGTSPASSPCVKENQLDQDDHATPEAQSPLVHEGQVIQDNYGTSPASSPCVKENQLDQDDHTKPETQSPLVQEGQANEDNHVAPPSISPCVNENQMTESDHCTPPSSYQLDKENQITQYDHEAISLSTKIIYDDPERDAKTITSGLESSAKMETTPNSALCFKDRTRLLEESDMKERRVKRNPRKKKNQIKKCYPESINSPSKRIFDESLSNIRPSPATTLRIHKVTVPPQGDSETPPVKSRRRVLKPKTKLSEDSRSITLPSKSASSRKHKLSINVEGESEATSTKRRPLRKQNTRLKANAESNKEHLMTRTSRKRKPTILAEGESETIPSKRRRPLGKQIPDFSMDIECSIGPSRTSTSSTRRIRIPDDPAKSKNSKSSLLKDRKTRIKDNDYSAAPKSSLQQKSLTVIDPVWSPSTTTYESTRIRKSLQPDSRKVEMPTRLTLVDDIKEAPTINKVNFENTGKSGKLVFSKEHAKKLDSILKKYNNEILMTRSLETTTETLALLSMARAPEGTFTDINDAMSIMSTELKKFYEADDPRERKFLQYSHFVLACELLYPGSADLWYCSLCSLESNFTNSVFFRNHFYRKHFICQRYFECELSGCEFQTRLPSNLYNHVIKEHQALGNDIQFSELIRKPHIVDAMADFVALRNDSVQHLYIIPPGVPSVYNKADKKTKQESQPKERMKFQVQTKTTTWSPEINDSLKVNEGSEGRPNWRQIDLLVVQDSNEQDVTRPDDVSVEPQELPNCIGMDTLKEQRPKRRKVEMK